MKFSNFNKKVESTGYDNFVYHLLVSFGFFFLFGINLSIASGLYLHDFYILILLVFWVLSQRKNSTITLKKNYIVGIIICFIPFFIISVADSISNSEIDLNSYFLPFKIFWLIFVSISFNFLFKIKNISDFSLHFIVIAIMIPVIFSLIMYISPAFEQSLLSIYDVEKYPTAFRYGGVFGKDVNTLGMYSTLILLLSINFFNYRRFLFGGFIFVISISGILLSGMRSGLLVLFSLFFISLFIKQFRLIPAVKIIFIFTACVFLFVLVFLYLDDSLQDIVIDRFSVERFFADMTYGESGNLTHATSYLEDTLFGYQSSLLTPLIGYGSELMFVDNMYVFLFLKYGVFAVLMYLFILLYAFWFFKDRLVRFILIFSLIISLKGVFVLGNYYVYLCFILIFINQYFKSECK